MKKLLIILSVILCISICFTSCDMAKGNDNDDVGGNGGGNGGASEASIQTIVDAFKSTGTLGELISNFGNNAGMGGDFSEILEADGECELDLSATMGGATASANGYIGFVDGVMALGFADTDASRNPSVFGFMTEDGKYVLVTQDNNGGYSAQVMDFGELSEQLEGALGSSGTPADSAIQAISELKLPELKATEISYKSGKYVISKAYWKRTAESAVDALLDEAKKEAAADDIAEIEEQAAEIKKMINGMLDEITFDIFFRAEGDKIVGFGFDIAATDKAIANIGSLVGEDLSEEIESFSVSLDIKTKGDYLEYFDIYVKVELPESDSDILVDVRFESIFDNSGKLAGFSADAKIEAVSTYYVGAGDNSGNSSSTKHVEKTSVNLKALLDLTKAKSAGSDLFKLELDCIVTDNGVKDQDMSISASVKACGGNRYDFSFDYDNAMESETSIEISGSLKYSEIASSFPAIPSGVIAAKNNALLNN